MKTRQFLKQKRPVVLALFGLAVISCVVLWSHHIEQEELVKQAAESSAVSSRRKYAVEQEITSAFATLIPVAQGSRNVNPNDLCRATNTLLAEPSHYTAQYGEVEWRKLSENIYQETNVRISDLSPLLLNLKDGCQNR